MVTWGQNQVFTFGSASTSASAPGAAPAPAATQFSFGGMPSAPASAPSVSLFGAGPAPAPSGSLFGAPSAGGLFGAAPSTPAGGLFGSAPPASPSGGFYGSAASPSTSLFGSAPAPSSGLFGSSSAPAPSGSLFGSFTPAPAPSGGLFGASTPSSSLFGTLTPSSYGAPPTQLQGPQIPAQAAMQAHIDASARLEAAKLQTALEKLHISYTGAPNNTDSKKNFLTIVYNDISPEQRQLQWMMGGYGHIVPPPKPPHVSDTDWMDAVVRNPDPNAFMPVALVGADALQTRIAWQQDRANTLSNGVAQLQAAHATLQRQGQRYEGDLQHLTKTHAALRKRLLEVMRKVELVRCMNLPLQQDEVTLGKRLISLHQQVDQIAKVLTSIQDSARTLPKSQPRNIVLPDSGELYHVLKEHREAITKLGELVQRDVHDLDLLKQQQKQHLLVTQIPLRPR